jgi:threonine/homoserine/homoserine lactone efflux protein
VDHRFLAFVAVSAALIIVPGPDMALVARNALRAGRTGVWSTALGVGTGILGWGAAAVFGLAALLAASATAFTIVKLAGAAYLLYLGIQSLRARDGRHEPKAANEPWTVRWVSTFRQGMLGNLLNPKAAVIFVTVIPQFIRPGDPAARLVLMLLVFEVMIVGWLTLYGLALCRAGQSRLGKQLQNSLRKITGLVLIGLALRVGLERS